MNAVLSITKYLFGAELVEMLSLADSEVKGCEAKLLDAGRRRGTLMQPKVDDCILLRLMHTRCFKELGLFQGMRAGGELRIGASSKFSDIRYASISLSDTHR